MKQIAVPIHDDQLNQHFGKSRLFRVFSVGDSDADLIAGVRDVSVPPGSACHSIAPALAQAGVNIVLAGGIGAGAVAALRRYGIETVTGLASASASDLVSAFLTGRLQGTGKLCNHHHEHAHECGSKSC